MKLMLLSCSMMGISNSHAEYFGSPTGRTASFASQPQMTVEATASTGNFESADYQQMGLRLNYRYSPSLLVFGDIGQSKLNSETETSLGFGAYYPLSQTILGSEHTAIKVSYHQVNFETLTSLSGGGVSITQNCRPDDPITFGGILDNDLAPGGIICLPVVTNRPGSSSSSGGDIRNIAIEMLISGEMPDSMLGENGANWYANGGIQMLNGDLTDDTILGVGTGIVLPLTNSEAYVGIDYADEMQAGIGFRYFVK